MQSATSSAYRSNRPEKNHPDQLADGSLTILNNLRAYLDSSYQKASGAAQRKKFSDALKVVDCLRFVKVNEAFLRYAYFADKTEEGVYSRTADHQHYVLRDFNGTALDFFIYQDESQYPDQKQAMEMCIAAHLGLVKDFEAAVEYVTKNGKLNEFIDTLQYDETTGCLVKRTAASLKYVEKLKKGLFIFEELMQAFIEGDQADAEEDPKDAVEQSEERKIKKSLIYFSPYLWKKCLYEGPEGLEETFITPDLIVDYWVNLFGYRDPRPSSLSQARPVSALVSESPVRGEAQALHQEAKTESTYLLKTSAEALKCIAEGRGLAKNISVPLKPQSGANHVDSLSYHVNQLNDPANYRPIKHLRSGTDRSHYWDPTDGKGYTRVVASRRGQPKPADWKYTKKEAATVLPRNGKIHLYAVTDPVFLLFNIKACYLKKSPHTGKPKYVWKGNANTNSKGWVGIDAWNRNRILVERSVTLEELGVYLQGFENSETIPPHNEILACFAKEALTAIGTQMDTLFDRLNALRVREMLRETLGVQLPILISTPQKGPRVYTRAAQLADLQMAKNYPVRSKEAKVLKRLHPQPSRLIERYRQQEVAAKTLLTAIQHSEEEALGLLRQHREFFMLEEEVEEQKNKALKLALKNKYRNLALYLIELGANLDYAESLAKNKKLFWLILESEDPALIAAALKNKPSEEALTQAIFLAAKHNKFDLVLTLLKLQPKLPLSIWHEDGKTALDFAHEHNNQEMLQALKAAASDDVQDKQANEEQPGFSHSKMKAVLWRIAKQLEAVQKTAAEKAALEKILVYIQILRGELQPEGGAELRLGPSAINELRKRLNDLLATEKLSTYSSDCYAQLHASLMALCYFFPINKTENGLSLSPSGKILRDDNRILTSTGLQLAKEEVRTLFAQDASPCYPNTTQAITARDRSYMAETAGPIYLKKFTPYKKDAMLRVGAVVSLFSYPLLTLLSVALLPESLAFIALILVAGGGLLPGFLLGVAAAAAVFYLSSPKTLEADLPNPRIQALLEMPEDLPSISNRPSLEEPVPALQKRVGSKDEGLSLGSHLVRTSAACLLMPPPRVLSSELATAEPRPALELKA